MPIKKLKPITPGQRGRTVNGFDAITTNKPEKSLLVPMKKTGGRNSQGRMTMKFRGGGHKKKYRIIDFKRNRSETSLPNACDQACRGSQQEIATRSAALATVAETEESCQTRPFTAMVKTTLP
jgi:ribosomal protein L2